MFGNQIWRPKFSRKITLNDPTKQDDKPCLPHALTLQAFRHLAAEYRASGRCSVRELSFARQLWPADLLDERIADRGHDAVG